MLSVLSGSARWTSWRTVKQKCYSTPWKRTWEERWNTKKACVDKAVVCCVRGDKTLLSFCHQLPAPVDTLFSLTSVDWKNVPWRLFNTLYFAYYILPTKAHLVPKVTLKNVCRYRIVVCIACSNLMWYSAVHMEYLWVLQYIFVHRKWKDGYVHSPFG